MAKVYWTDEVRKLFDKKIYSLMGNLLDDPDADIGTLKSIRICRQFSNEMIKEMEELDRLDEEARKKVEESDAEGSA